MRVRIATRKSPLALWQAHRVADLITGIDEEIETELVSMDTFADLRLDLPIAELGGKGAFSKEVQNVLLAGRADIAVHSAKDLQAVTPTELLIAAVPERGDRRDALVGERLEGLPEGGLVATGGCSWRSCVPISTSSGCGGTSAPGWASWATSTRW